MNKSDLKILCIDDENEILNYYAFIIEQCGFTPIITSKVNEVQQILANEASNIALILCDFKMPEMNGFELRKTIVNVYANIPFIIVSSYVSREMALEALELRITAFYDKPIQDQDLVKMIEKESSARVESIKESALLESVFIEEAASIIDDMEATLLSLDSDRNNQDGLNLLFRAAHTLKGSSGVLESDIFAKYIHKYEDIISGLRTNQIPFTNEIYEALLKGYDRIKQLLVAVMQKTIRQVNLDSYLTELNSYTTQSASAKKSTLAESPNPPMPGTTQQGQAQKIKDSISVPTSLLDELASFSGEITVIRNMVNKLVHSLEIKFVGDRDVQSLGELFDEMNKINSIIQNRLTDLRKVPMSGVIKPIPRILRDLARDLGKKIKWQVQGESLRIDNSLAQVCSNSLIHLIRNSADHGLESPAERVSSGKSEEGIVSIVCREEHEAICISVTDDGKGINPKKIKEKALEKGLYSAEQLAQMSDQQALRIIFLSGFSTSTKVTDVSGRGVGMDMVRASVEAIGGNIEIQSQVGKGSTFTLNLPIPRSVLIINSLLVLGNQRQFAVPQDTIIRVMRIEPTQFEKMIQKVADGNVLRTKQGIYPIVHLNDVLKIPTIRQEATLSNSQDTIDILILKSDDLAFALKVDSILDIEEIVVKRLQTCFNPFDIYAGATFLGDGQVGLIINPSAIAKLANITSTHEKEVTNAPNEENATNDLQKDFVLFRLNSKSVYGVPLEQVFRLEDLNRSDFQVSGTKEVVIYRKQIMPVVSLNRLLNLNQQKPGDTPLSANLTPNLRAPTVVISQGGNYLGLEVTEVIDIASTNQEISTLIRDRRGILGNTLISNQTVTIVDVAEIMKINAADSLQH